MTIEMRLPTIISARFIQLLLWNLVGMFLFMGCAIIQKPYTDAPIDFPYEMQSESYHLSQLQGKPVLLVLVRTSEVTNEMYLDELQDIYKKIKNHVTLLVLSIAPNEAPMLDMFVEFHNYPFFIGMADWTVANGQSQLGKIPDVPTTYLLSKDSRILDMGPGATNGEKIIQALKHRNILP